MFIKDENGNSNGYEAYNLSHAEFQKFDEQSGGSNREKLAKSWMIGYLQW
mgnify:CR=1 FL=1